jgi:hypothetical protein
MEQERQPIRGYPKKQGIFWQTGQPARQILRQHRKESPPRSRRYAHLDLDFMKRPEGQG